MFDKPVYLPDRTHYKLDEVARAIADLFPENPDNTKGVDCISEKLLAPIGYQSELDPEPLNLYIAKFFARKSALTKDDRERLSLMLPRLPEISHFMSAEEIRLFFDQYYQIPSRPSWEPSITTPSDRQRMAEDYQKCVNTHSENYINKVKNGTFNAMDNKLSILSGNEPNARHIAIMTKEDAIGYIKFLKLKLIIKDHLHEKSFINNQETNKNESAKYIHSKNSASTKNTLTRKSKRDLLIQAIENFQKNSGQHWTVQSMWLEFQKMAKKQEAPFISSAKGVVNWQDDQQRPHSLTLKALKARLDRQEERLTNLDVRTSQVSDLINLPI